MKTFLIRTLFGLVLVGILLTALFALTMAVIPTWGATSEEIVRSLPGDNLVTKPTLLWTNAITINAPPKQVWPWVAQMGDSRGGFYSYTFIENQVGKLTGAENYQVVYTNANEITPEWQNPQPGEPLIQGSIKVREVELGRYLLADSIQPAPFLWIWCWYLEPARGGDMTRLISRFAIEVPDTAGENPVMGFMLNVGGFVMHQNMMQGIKLRAEGLTEPAWIESVEIGLWLVALLSGLVAAFLYITRKAWRWPFFVAMLSVIVIFVLTFIQPPMLVRFLLDGVLIAGLVWITHQG